MLKYLDFIKENKNNFNSLGEWVESLCENNEEILDLIKPYLEDTNPSVKISNTINCLEDIEKKSVEKIVSNYLNNNGRKGDILTFVDMTNERLNIKAGKNIFSSFLRVITSLGLYDIEATWKNIPDDFIIYFYFETDKDIKTRFERFPSLSMFSDRITPNSKLFFGIKDSLIFEFGISNSEDDYDVIGSFKLNDSVLRFLQMIDSRSATHLKKELVFLNFNRLKMLSSIIKHMKKFHPGETEDRAYKINNGIIELGYKGLKVEDINDIKNNFREHLKNLRFSNKLQMSVNLGKENWLLFQIAIK